LTIFLIHSHISLLTCASIDQLITSLFNPPYTQQSRQSTSEAFAKIFEIFEVWIVF
jgi:hypothetical protein